MKLTSLLPVLAVTEAIVEKTDQWVRALGRWRAVLC